MRIMIDVCRDKKRRFHKVDDGPLGECFDTYMAFYLLARLGRG